ncbi:MAG: hypothetical protein QXO51_04385 [Halobacteria archaeon]
MAEAVARLDDKGRLLLPKEVRDETGASEFLVLSDRFGIRLVPRVRRAGDLRGSGPRKVPARGLREKTERAL